jgi:hypothetical protein
MINTSPLSFGYDVNPKSFSGFQQLKQTEISVKFILEHNTYRNRLNLYIFPCKSCVTKAPIYLRQFYTLQEADFFCKTYGIIYDLITLKEEELNER